MPKKSTPRQLNVAATESTKPLGASTATKSLDSKKRKLAVNVKRKSVAKSKVTNAKGASAQKKELAKNTVQERNLPKSILKSVSVPITELKGGVVLTIPPEGIPSNTKASILDSIRRTFATTESSCVHVEIPPQLLIDKEEEEKANSKNVPAVSKVTLSSDATRNLKSVSLAFNKNFPKKRLRTPIIRKQLSNSAQVVKTVGNVELSAFAPVPPPSFEFEDKRVRNIYNHPTHSSLSVISLYNNTTVGGTSSSSTMVVNRTKERDNEEPIDKDKDKNVDKDGDQRENDNVKDDNKNNDNKDVKENNAKEDSKDNIPSTSKAARKRVK